MSTDELNICLVRRDETRNMARFYHLTITNNLFGETIVLRRWGGIGTPGKTKEVISKDLTEAERYIGTLALMKTKRGYRLPQ